MKQIIKNELFIKASLAISIIACKESTRFEINYADTEPPGMPIVSSDYTPLYGGVRIYFKAPADQDVLTVDAKYLNQKGEEVWFSESFYADSLNIYGFSDTLPKLLSIYAVDRAGNKSDAVQLTVVPKEPAVTRTASTAYIKAGFGSFHVNWRNELRQNMNVYVDFSYKQNGEQYDRHVIYTTADTVVRQFIRIEDLPETEPINVKMYFEDRYGNVSNTLEMGTIYLLKDEKIPKDKWTMPLTNDSIGGQPMGYFDSQQGRVIYLIDDIIDYGLKGNYCLSGGVGRTGMTKDGNLPCNIMIDLGEEWELSRVITWQYYTQLANESSGRGEYYAGSNIWKYNMYIWNTSVTDMTSPALRLNR